MADLRTETIDPHPLDARGFLLATAGAAAWFTIGYVRWNNVRAGASDMGIFDQTSWLLSHGRAPFVTSIGINVFADHVSPIVALFAPLYLIAATPVWLIGAQAVCLGLTVVPLRALAVELDAPPWLAVVLTLASPALWSAAVYDVHPVVFATPAVAWALLAARRGDVRAATLAGIAVMLCRADAVTALAGIAVVAVPVVRRRLLWLVPIPLVLSVTIPRVLGTWQTFPHYYRSLGTSWADAMIHPWRIALALTGPSALLQMLLWLLPLAFLPLLRPRWFAAMVVAGFPLLVSSWPGIQAPWYHHAAFLVPIGIGGALAAWAGLEPQGAAHANPRRAIALRGTLAVCATVALLAASPFSPRAPNDVRITDVLDPPVPGTQEGLAAVGPTEPESSSNLINGHLSRRAEAYNFPCPFPGTHDGRTCDHPNLFDRASRVSVVVVYGNHDLSWLDEYGSWQFARRGDVTIARKVGTSPR